MQNCEIIRVDFVNRKRLDQPAVGQLQRIADIQETGGGQVQTLLTKQDMLSVLQRHRICSAGTELERGPAYREAKKKLQALSTERLTELLVAGEYAWKNNKEYYVAVADALTARMNAAQAHTNTRG